MDTMNRSGRAILDYNEPFEVYDSGNVYILMLSSTLSGGSRRLSEDIADLASISQYGRASLHSWGVL